MHLTHLFRKVTPARKLELECNHCGRILPYMTGFNEGTSCGAQLGYGKWCEGVFESVGLAGPARMEAEERPTKGRSFVYDFMMLPHHSQVGFLLKFDVDTQLEGEKDVDWFARSFKTIKDAGRVEELRKLVEEETKLRKAEGWDNRPERLAATPVAPPWNSAQESLYASKDKDGCGVGGALPVTPVAPEVMHLLVSVSGGKTSGKMAKELRDSYQSPLVEMHFAFANTGREDEKTLAFVRKMDDEWDLGIVWLEAVVHPGKVASTHKVVTFETASRKGEPFEAVIAKYGIPNKKYLHCTRELKLNPIRSYMQSIGVPFYFTAVGIRADEPKRVRTDAASAGVIYPMVSMFPANKEMVNDWWEDQDFRLDLPEHRGNCTTCHKKSLKKLVMVAQETPEEFAFNARMESLHGLSGHNIDGRQRTFFRENRSTQDILSIAQLLNPKMPFQTDISGGCDESCEPF